MRQEEQDRLKRLLQKAIPPVDDSTLARDLWPAMLHTMEQKSMEVHWFDWALAALVVIWFFFYPEGVLRFLYHL
jgi:hypothetical protein